MSTFNRKMTSRGSSSSSRTTLSKHILLVQRPRTFAIQPSSGVTQSSSSSPASHPCPKINSVTGGNFAGVFTVNISGTGFVPGVTFTTLDISCPNCVPSEETVLVVPPNDPRIKITPISITFTETTPANHFDGIFAAYAANCCMDGKLSST